MQDGVDLDQRAARQPGDADRGARRKRLAYVLRHDFVDASKVRKIRQVDRHAHGLVEARAGCGGDGREVAEHPVGLAVDALGQLHGRRVETDLARQVHGVVRSNRLRVSADRLGRVARLDRGLHGGYLSLMISDLEKLLGTPRDGALLRFSLGVQYAKAGEHERAIGYLRDSVASDPLYSAAWKALGKALAAAGRRQAQAEQQHIWKRIFDQGQRLRNRLHRAGHPVARQARDIVGRGGNKGRAVIGDRDAPGTLWGHAARVEGSAHGRYRDVPYSQLGNP